MKTNQPNSGFILIMTLLLITVFSMLILTSLQRLIYTTRTNEHVKMQHQAFYALEAVAKTLQTTFSTLPGRCKMNHLSMNDVTRQGMLQQGCSLEQAGVVYTYLFVDLGVFPCLMISAENKNYSSHHWWVILSSEQMKHKILWIRFALPAFQSICPSKSMEVTIHHPLSWRLQSEALIRR